MKFTLASLAAALIGAVQVVAQNTTDPVLTAADVWVYGLAPLSILETRQAFLLNAGLGTNQIVHQAVLSTADNRFVVKPNADTVYSIAFYDLSLGPVKLHLPNVTDRYFVAALYDANSNNFANPRRGGNYTLYSQRDAPALRNRTSYDIVSPTDDIWQIGRIYVKNSTDADYAIVRRYQANFTVVAAPPKTVELPPVFRNASDTVNAYYRLNNAVTNFSNITKYTSIGLSLLRPFRPLANTSIYTLGQARANATILASALRFLRPVNNGWVLPQSDLIGNFGRDYAVRSLIAQQALGALTSDQAIYPLYTGQRLVADISTTWSFFFADGAPPTDSLGFWSLTAYDADSFFVKNDINRYKLGSSDNLTKNTNGSFTITASVAPPNTTDLRRNWLPIAPGVFQILLRAYLPRNSTSNGTWAYPVVTRN
ncbi:hypothetical protein PYCC9005_002235 [Savitreella phatthalungensis]